MKSMIWRTLNFYERLKEVQRLQGLALRQRDIALLMGVVESTIQSFCKKNNLVGLSQGAQRGNKNAIIDGLSKNTIKRLTRIILLNAHRNLYTCERCNYSQKIELPRHHKDRNRANNSVSNLEVLCSSCHAKEHMTDRERTDRGTFL